MKIQTAFSISLELNRDEFKYLLEMMGRSSETDMRTILTNRKGLSKEFVDNAVKFSSRLYAGLNAMQ